MQGLEHIFPRQDHIAIFSKLLLNCTMDTLMLSKTDNKNLSSAKRVTVEEILLLRSFKYTLDRKGSVRYSTYSGTKWSLRKQLSIENYHLKSVSQKTFNEFLKVA